MRFTATSRLAAIVCLAINVRALPHPAPPATYNVVDVGGPSSTSAETATVYETVKTTLSAKHTVTEVVSAGTTTVTPEAVATTQANTSATTSTEDWSVVTGSAPTSTSISSSSTNCTTKTSSSPTSMSTSTTTPCATTSMSMSAYASIAIESSTHTADDGLYRPTGDLGLYTPWAPAATILSTSVAAAYYPLHTNPIAPYNATGSGQRR